jgi:hypothetical protein
MLTIDGSILGPEAALGQPCGNSGRRPTQRILPKAEEKPVMAMLERRR